MSSSNYGAKIRDAVKAAKIIAAWDFTRQHRVLTFWGTESQKYEVPDLQDFEGGDCQIVSGERVRNQISTLNRHPDVYEFGNGWHGLCIALNDTTDIYFVPDSEGL